MSILRAKQQTRVCPQTDRRRQPDHKGRWVRWLFPFTGLVALIWFLVRVIPKPSRATYPCQRVAFPMASGFIVWLLSLGGACVLFNESRRLRARARTILAAICVAGGMALLWTALSRTDPKISYGLEPRFTNQPIGEGRGVHPGRVAWIHDPNATNWAGPGSGQRWYSNTCTNQQVVNQMLSKALRAITGRGSDHAAWDALFRDFNRHRGRPDVGYTPGERIAIKVNFTLMYSNPPSMDKPSSLVDQTDNSPQLAIALLRQLTDAAGVRPGDISIGDPGRIMPNYWYALVEPNCPGVVYLTRSGTANSGRTIAISDTTAPFYWSDPLTSHWTGVSRQDYIPTHLAQADYFINLPVLKSHDTGGITICGKNYYGSLIRNPDAAGYFSMHRSRPADSPGMGQYRAIVDLMGHPRLGGKTLLAVIDGLYAGTSWDSRPVKWKMSPFNNDWPSSLIVSQDQVAADSVGFDFMYAEWAGSSKPYPGMSGAEDYLHEAAMVPNPASGTLYDPNHDGGLTEGLGVHEHWNNAVDRQYSRNLGTGPGIELVTAAPGCPDLNGDGWVDLRDFAVFAGTWQGRIGEAPFDPNNDVSMPADDLIDERDLVVFCDNWLESEAR